MQETDSRDSLIALLEWELAAAQARVAEYRLRMEALRQHVGFRAGVTPRSFLSHECRSVKKRALARVLMLLDEPDDDKRLRQRIESARWEARHG